MYEHNLDNLFDLSLYSILIDIKKLYCEKKMTSMIEPMDVDSSFQDDGEDEVDTHSNIFGDDENSSYSSTLFVSFYLFKFTLFNIFL